MQYCIPRLGSSKCSTVVQWLSHTHARVPHKPTTHGAQRHYPVQTMSIGGSAKHEVSWSRAEIFGSRSSMRGSRGSMSARHGRQSGPGLQPRTPRTGTFPHGRSWHAQVRGGRRDPNCACAHGRAVSRPRCTRAAPRPDAQVRGGRRDRDCACLTLASSASNWLRSSSRSVFHSDGSLISLRTPDFHRNTVMHVVSPSVSNQK